ncbi:HAD hydrolase-like protein [Vibrio sp. IRLE0018]|uniref:HAD family hydrolase n=1 Tax=Vibrio TaxID=662 RepID=UPI0015931301|nr:MULTISPECIES: HAD family hydrolase [Vibrio]MCF8778837.1 HAD hydrolase-like protein [Vibrio floridensis]NVC62020.1 HAD family hydrolase [Vibrio sp. 05-20-BW147]HAS6347487.1 HAD hydrolase-like protein [Vibrio vulnificus]
MHKAILFDWGNTLMKDDASQTGKMRYWEQIQLINGAKEVLEALSERYDIYIATGAADSTIEDIHATFQRGEIDVFIKGYFNRENIPFAKGSSDFYLAISASLGLKPNQLCMIGDSLQKDILPAKKAGLTAVWLQEEVGPHPSGIVTIQHLHQLCAILL